MMDEFGLDLEHFLFVDRTCRKCLRTMSLVDNFYLTRKDRSPNPSAYSYECKECTIKRVSRSVRKHIKHKDIEQNYPDW
jgi:phosphopantetheinyl transferase (holo-ACP synthase)